MYRISFALFGASLFLPALADDVSGTSELLCATNRVMVCFETGDCFAVEPWEVDMPEFVVIDTRQKLIATTESSGVERSTSIANLSRDDGRITAQGSELGRLFSLVVDDLTGILSAAIVRDGFTVSAYGVCTDADVKRAR